MTHLTRDETIDLLTVIAAYDRRTIGAGDIAAWTEAARRANWTYPAAVDAVHNHFANSAAWLMPGHITDRIRQTRRQPAPADQILELEKPTATAESRAAFMRQMSEQLASRKDVNR